MVVKENYKVREPYFREIVSKLGMVPTVDGFAEVGNAQCPRFFTAREDSFAHEWGEGEVMWLNPPWSMWPQVVENLMGSRSAAICI